MEHVIEPLEACSKPRVLSFLLGPGEDLGSLFPSIRSSSRAIVRKGLFWLLLVHAICPLEARWPGRNWRESTFSPGWTLIGRCRGKPAPTHILHNIRWAEALSLCEGKSTIFCASNVELVPDRSSIQAIQAIEAEQQLIARPAVRLH